MLFFVLILAGFGGLLLKLRGLLSMRNLACFVLGSLGGSLGASIILSVLASAHPITEDPGPQRLRLMMLSFQALVLACGLLAGMWAVRIAQGTQPGSGEQGPGFSADQK